MTILLRARLPGLLALAAAGLPACHAPTPCAPTEPGFARDVRARLELPVAEPPYAEVRANWKERLDQPYAYVELHGSYTETARALKDVMSAVAAAGLEPAGAPFALFYDDPGATSVGALRSRACVPVEAASGWESKPIAAPYALDVLPGTTVVYAYVGGPYGDVPRAYPGVFGYVKHLGWKECGPVREIYLVPPGSVQDWNELVCEVQVPASPAR